MILRAGAHQPGFLPGDAAMKAHTRHLVIAVVIGLILLVLATVAAA